MRFEPTATVLADSTAYGSRLTTMEVQMHRFVLPEFLTHRLFSRNGASSRAIPVQKMIAKAKEANVEPLYWGSNCRGMSAREELTGAQLEYAKQAWNIARARAIDVVEAMVEANVHKQIVNRILEPYLPMTMVVTGDERAYANFFSQRCHPDAQPEIQALAYAMQLKYNTNEPRELKPLDWHLPFYSRELAELPIDDCVKACVARCARVSYDNHNGERDISADIRLYDKLVQASPPHLSPLEHVARVYPNLDNVSRGNFCAPWLQLRKWVEYMKEIN